MTSSVPGKERDRNRVNLGDRYVRRRPVRGAYPLDFSLSEQFLES